MYHDKNEQQHVQPEPLLKIQDNKKTKDKAHGSTVVVAFVNFMGEVSRQAAREAAKALGAERVEIHRLQASDSGGLELIFLEAEGPKVRRTPLALVLGDAQNIEVGLSLVEKIDPSVKIERVGLLIGGHLALAENMDGRRRMGDELKASLRRAQSEARHSSANELFVGRLMRQAMVSRP